jgi:dsDNA-specific endonuclease/ATPase MutS2
MTEDPFGEPVEIPITDVFDLHSIPPRGVGVQREMVRKVLGRTSFVEHFSDAPAEAGGWGATLAALSPRPI